MSFEQEFLCEKLCEASRAVIGAWAMVKEWRRIEEYLFRCSEGYYVTYDGKTGMFLDADIEVFCQDGLTVTVEPLGGMISGTVGGKSVCSCVLPEDVAEELFLMARRRWKEDYRYIEPDVEEGEYTRFVPNPPL